MNTTLQTKNTGAVLLDANGEASNYITATVENLVKNPSLLTRWRLRDARSREAIKFAEESIVEYMAAKRRAFVSGVALAEDYVLKRLLEESMKHTEVVERDIAHTMANAQKNFEALVLDREREAYRDEVRRIAEVQAQFDAKEMSERRFMQAVANIEESTDRVIRGVQETTRGLLENLSRRFNAAVQRLGST